MSNAGTKIIFFGTPDLAVPFLDALLERGYTVLAVVTAPDKPTGRKQTLTPPPVKTAAERSGLTVIQPKTLKDDAFFEQFVSLKPDMCVVVAYGKIIPDKYLNVPKFGFVNVHPSLLPKYRGPSPIQSAILNGETETGVSLMLLDKEVDHGPLLANVKCKMTNDEYYPELRERLTELGKKLLLETLPKYISGELKPQKQDHDRATFTKMLTRTDGRIDWSKPAQKLYNQVRALNPEPGTWTTWPSPELVEGKGKTLNILKARLESGTLVPEEIQLEGGKPMSLADFLNGHPGFDISQLE